MRKKINPYTQKLEYIKHLERVRNDFYNRGNYPAAFNVQCDINRINFSRE